MTNQPCSRRISTAPGPAPGSALPPAPKSVPPPALAASDLSALRLPPYLFNIPPWGILSIYPHRVFVKFFYVQARISACGNQHFPLRSRYGIRSYFIIPAFNKIQSHTEKSRRHMLSREIFSVYIHNAPYCLAKVLNFPVKSN